MKKKVVVARIKKEDFDFFKSISKKESSKEVFEDVKNLTIKGLETVNTEKKLDQIGCKIYGRKLWQNLFK